MTRRVYQLGTVAFMKVMMRTCQHVGALIKPDHCHKYKFNLCIINMQYFHSMLCELRELGALHCVSCIDFVESIQKVG